MIRREAEIEIKVVSRKGDSIIDKIGDKLDKLKNSVITLDAKDKGVEKTVDSIEKKLDKIKDVDIDVDVDLDSKEVDKKIKELQQAKAEIKVDAKLDSKVTKSLLKDIEKAKATIQADIDLDDKEAKRQLDKLKKESRDIQIRANLDADRVRSEIKLINKEIKAIADAEIKLDADTKPALNAVDNLKKEVKNIDAVVTVGVDDAALSGVLSSIGGKFAGLKGPATIAGAAIGAALFKGVTGSINADELNFKLSSALGLTVQESERVGAVAGSLYGSAYGESLEEVNATIQQILGNGLIDLGTQSNDALEGASSAALNLASIMDADVNEVIQASSKLLKTGLADSAEEAFDQLTAAAQGGANSTGELLEIIDEYSINWAEAGFSGEEALGQIVSATKTGTFQVERLGDLIKESGIKLQELDSNKIELVTKATGLASKELETLADSARSGDSVSFLKLVESIKNIENTAERSRAAVELFGTPFEELGDSAFLQIDFSAQLENIAGAADRLDEERREQVGVRIEELKRQASGALTDIAEVTVVPALEAILPPLLEAVKAFRAFFDTAGENEGLNDFIKIVKEDIAPVIQDVLLKAFEDFSKLMEEDIIPVIKEDLVPLFESLGPALEQFANYMSDIVIPSITASLGIVFGVIGGVITQITGFINIITGIFQGDGEKIKEGFSQIFEGFEKIIRSILDNILGFFGVSLEDIADTVQGAFSGIKLSIESIWGEISAFFTTIWDAIKLSFTASVDAVKDTVVNGFNTIKDKATSAIETLKNNVTKPFNAIKDVVQDVIDKIQSFIDKLKSIPSSIPNPLDSLANSIPGAGLLSNIGFNAFGGVGNKPRVSFLSEFGHEEAVLPTGAPIGHIKNILGQAQNDVLGRLYQDFAANSAPANITNGGSHQVNVTVEDRGGRSQGERLLNAHMIGSAISRRLVRT